MMKISLATLSKRHDAVLDALKRNEKISISHNGQVVAVLQPPEAARKRESMLRVCPKTSTTSLDKEPSPDSKFLPRFWQKFTRRAKVTRYKLVALVFGRALNTPAFGMWADRDDMTDPNEWRRSLRKKRRDNLSCRTGGGNA
ncbi:MAG: hypothetical protein LBU64_07705 [Planctomycetota bacterium]|jgi:antitoxin (DNA-binding transcriptional repressor) of toxin-antitoxin stability system|nr:hypothetical protein [Planctomycetota bacterium]